MVDGIFVQWVATLISIVSVILIFLVMMDDYFTWHYVETDGEKVKAFCFVIVLLTVFGTTIWRVFEWGFLLG